MRYRWMLLGVFVLLRTSGCQQHLFTDYRPLDQAGMWSSNVEELKKLNTSDTEVAQLVKAKQAGLSDDACVTLGSAKIGRLKNTGLTEKQILERINEGITDAQADREAAAREAARNHSGIGFQRVHGRR